MVRRSTSMMYGGASLVVLGAVVLGTGIGVAVAGGSRVQVYAPGGYVFERRADEGMRDAGIAVAVLGAVAMAVGIPVWAIGARKEPAKKPEIEPAPGSAPPGSAPPAGAAASVRVGPGGVSLDLAF